MTDKINILRVDSSAMGTAGQSTRLSTLVIDGLKQKGLVANVTQRDLNNSLPHLDQDWVIANNTPDAERSSAQAETLALSDSLIAEIEAADLLIIGTPIYNFAIPASLKSWIDLVCRARKTFAYSESGPQGLMTGKKAIITYSSGGTPIGSEIEFASDYMRHIMGFIGISDVEFVAADQHFMVEGALAAADQSANDLIGTLSSQYQAA